MGIGIKVDAADIRIPAADISVRYWRIPTLDGVPLVRYRTGSGICVLYHSGAGLTGCCWKGGHPACTYCWLYKDTLRVHTVLLLVSCTSILLAWWRDTLHVHTTGAGQEYLLFHIRLVVVLNLLCDVDKS